MEPQRSVPSPEAPTRRGSQSERDRAPASPMRAPVSDGHRETGAHVRLWLLSGLLAGLLAFSSSTQVGLGWDEPEYIRAGTAYTYWFTDAPDRLSDQSIRDFWTWQHTHPPLGQLLAGIMVRLLAGLRLPLLSTVGIIAAARIAPALCFGGTVALLAGWCERELGTRTAFLAGLSLLLFPRVFGAAQFVSLDVPMMFTWLLAVVAWEWALAGPRPAEQENSRTGEQVERPGSPAVSCSPAQLLSPSAPSPRPPVGGRPSLRAVLAPRALLAAGALGLALLTKLNALFLPLVLWPWALLRYGRRALGPILASLLLAPLLFFLCWPWLYHDTVARAATYLLDKMSRPALPVYYLGWAYVDAYAPWHYPVVMLAVTVPLGLLVASVLGLIVACRRRPPTAVTGSERSLPLRRHAPERPTIELALVNLTAILVVAMLPWAPKYDGVRLFLPVFPFLAVLTGLGLEAMFRWVSGLEYVFRPLRWRRLGWAAGVTFLLTQSVGLIWAWPFHLTYYNMVVGGLRGAERLGFESIYWGEAFDRSAWAALDELALRQKEPRAGVAVGSRVRVAFAGMAKEVPEFLQQHGYLSDAFVPLGPQASDVDYVVVGRREGSLAREGWLRALAPTVLAQALFVHEHHGVPLCWIVRRADVPAEGGRP